MASFINTMSVPAAPAPAHLPASSEKYTPYSPPPRTPSLSLSPSGVYQTTRTSHVHLLEPPSYLSPAVRALKQGCFGLTPPSNARTRAPFKPRSAAKGTSSYQLRQFAEATLGSGSLRKAVKLPEGEDLNEWLAVNGAFGRGPGLVWAYADCDCWSSGRLLQPDQPPLRLDNRVLLAADMSRDEGYR